jgi:WD40 repeat protein
MLSLEGHEDWVRCLALTPWGDSLLLATGAQDNYVRLWRIAPAGSGSAGLDLLDEFEQRIGDQRNVQLSTKAHVLSVSDNGVSRRFNVTLEALLVGHESGLTNVHWSPHEHPLLLSSAADNSLIIWAPTEGSGTKDGMWVPEHRFGSLGGRGLAFFGAVWDASGDTVIGTGWTGGVERWIRKDAGWAAAPGLTGHFGPVQSVAWDPRGDYLLSTSSDQTSRVHAACKSAASAAAASVWAEIARPQIHGYDLVDAAFLSPFRFASAAEEKVMRVFDATGGFAGSLRGLGVCAVSAEDEVSCVTWQFEQLAKLTFQSALPVGATVPPLGLSNRALGKNMTEPEIKTMNESRDSVSVSLTTLPTEEELNTSTLWPEIEKIYGHGYEVRPQPELY